MYLSDLTFLNDTTSILAVIIISLIGAFLTSFYLVTSKPPIAPGCELFIGHSRLFLRNNIKLASILLDRTSSKNVSRFKFPFYELWMIRGSPEILSVLSNPKIFDFEPMKHMVLQRLLGVSPKAIRIAIQDDSGVSTKPSPYNSRPLEKRFNYMERKATLDFIRPPSHAVFLEKFEENLYHWLDRCEITKEWSALPDLYVFVRDIVFESTTNAFFGPNLLAQNPHLYKDFWEYDKCVPFLASGLPRALNPGAAKVRERCVKAMQKWRLFALNRQTKASKLPEWNEISGLKCMSHRNEVFQQFDEWDENSCAASDFAVLYGLNANTTGATFWLFFEILQSRDLLSEATTELFNITQFAPHFEMKKLLDSPLLQSIYAETLRMYVSVLMVRQTRAETKIGPWTIPKKTDVAVCNYSEHMSKELWDLEGNDMTHPVDEFWGQRFITYSPHSASNPSKINTKTGGEKEGVDRIPRFSLEGLNHKWLPFGAGERMCPGRHFTKHQMILTFAVLFTFFDIELQVADSWKQKPDMKHFGYGVMPPQTQTPFKIRRKF